MVLRFLRNEDGQDVIEWAALAAFLSTLMILCVTTIDDVLDGWYDSLETDVNSVGSPI
jgi:Flp pilus assembly pilin Flp